MPTPQQTAQKCLLNSFDVYQQQKDKEETGVLQTHTHNFILPQTYSRITSQQQLN